LPTSFPSKILETFYSPKIYFKGMGRKTLVDRRIKTFPTPLMPIVYIHMKSMYIIIMSSYIDRKGFRNGNGRFYHNEVLGVDNFMMGGGISPPLIFVIYLL